MVTELAEPQAPCTPFYHSGVDAMLKNKQPAFIAISLLRTILCKQPPATRDGRPLPKTLPDLHFPPPLFSFFSCRLRLSFPLGIKCLSSRVRPAEHGPGTPGRPPPPAACDRQSHSPRHRHRPRPRFFGGDHLFAPSPLPAPGADIHPDKQSEPPQTRTQSRGLAMLGGAPRPWGTLPAPPPGRHTAPRTPSPCRAHTGRESGGCSPLAAGEIKLFTHCSAQPPSPGSHLLPPRDSAAAGEGSRALPQIDGFVARAEHPPAGSVRRSASR